METPCFLTDIYLQQMLYALTIRSPVAKGRLISVECPGLPGNYTLITARDIPGKNSIENSNLPVLASDELSYIGEPVALLLGPEKNILEEYSKHCKVIAEEETPVFSPEEAADIVASRDICVGDPAAAFGQAASIVRGSYTTGIQEQWYAEPTGAVAQLGEIITNGAVVGNVTYLVQTATQWPFHVKRSVARVLGISVSRVLVKPTLIGLHMDGKVWYPSLVSCHAALGAWITGKPVRLVLTGKEDFLFSPKRCGTEINIANALNEKGEITGIEINTTVNLGAYAVNADETLDLINLGCLGVYKTKNIRLRGTAVRTNIPPQGPFAGFGLAQGFFAIERHVSNIADSIRVDPAQWRVDNCIQTATLPMGLPIMEPPAGKQLIENAMQMSDYRRKWASYELLRQSRKHSNWTEYGEGLRGIGVALGYQTNGLLHSVNDKGSYSIELILEKDGTLEIKTSMVSSDSGNRNMWADIASEILGVEKGMIQINSGTDCPDSGPLIASRYVTVLARLVEQACLAIRKKRFRDPLPICVRKATYPQRNPVWDERFLIQKGLIDYSSIARSGWASAIVEVEIDPIEYFPEIRGVWMSVDGGKIVSEYRARRSLKTSVMQALGWAYREQINYINGAIPTVQFENFCIPGIHEIPRINIDFISDRQNEPKGIGDLPFTCIPAAFAQAVSQAIGYHFQSIPLNVLDIWHSGTKGAKKEGQA